MVEVHWLQRFDGASWAPGTASDL